MKKGLLSLASVALMSLGVFAQTWDDVKADYSVTISPEIKTCTGITDMTNDAVKDHWATDSKHYSFAVKDNVLEIEFEKKDLTSEDPDWDGKNWTVVNFTWGLWADGNKPKLTADPTAERDTLIGYVLDISNLVSTDLYIYGKYKLTNFEGADTEEMELRYDLVDCNGHISNAASPAQVLKAAADFADLQLDFPNTDLRDQYSGNWWDIKVRGAETQISKDGSPVDFTDVKVVVDSTLITQLQFTLDQGELAAVGKKYTLSLKDLAIGGGDKSVAATDLFPAEPVSIESDGSSIIYSRGVVTADGEIVVKDIFGTTVATGVDEVIISDLPTAPYIIQAEGASVPVIK